MFGYLNLDLKMSNSFPKDIIWLALTCGDIFMASWCIGTLKISWEMYVFLFSSFFFFLQLLLCFQIASIEKWN